MTINQPLPPVRASIPTLATPTPASAPVRPTPVSLPLPPRPAKTYAIKGPQRRATAPDLTGLYEHVPPAGKNSGLMLQLNQAGRTLVGWFCPPPRHVLDTAPMTTMPNPGVGLRPGVLFCVGDGDWSEPSLMRWVEAPYERTRQPEPDRFDFDPLDLFSVAGARNGLLMFQGPDMGLLGQEVRIIFSADGRHATDRTVAANWDRFRRVGRGPRIPGQSAAGLERALRERVIADQIVPEPTTFVDIAVGRLLGTGPAPGTPLELTLQRWTTAKDLARRLERDRIADLLSAEFNLKSVERRYLPALTAMARHRLSLRTLKLGTSERSLLGWLRLVAGERIDEIVLAQRADPSHAMRRSSDAVMWVFDTLGISGVGAAGDGLDFLYQIEFVPASDALGAAVANYLTGQEAGGSKTFVDRIVDKTREGIAKAVAKTAGKFLASPGGVYLGVTGTYGVYSLKVTRSRVKVKRNPEGDVKLKDGKPELEGTPQLDWQSTNDLVVAYFGCGSGVKANTSGVTSFSSPGMSKTEIISSLDLTVSDFRGAMVSSTVAGGPKAAVGQYASLDTFTSRDVEFYLSAERGGMVLGADETTVFKPSVVQPSNLLPELKEDFTTTVANWTKKWNEPELEARLFDLSGAVGVVAQFTNQSSEHAPDYVPPPRRGRPTNADAGRPLVQESFFALDSADVDDSLPPNYADSPRELLEVCLATYLAYAINPLAHLETFATTSPEQPTADNLALSDARARAIRQATRDALGPALRAVFTPEDCHGLGEGPAIHAGLLDPESPQLSGLAGAAFTNAVEAQRELWPQWRRADLYINGEAVVSFGEE
jgi:hypothetical protein